MKLPLKTLEKFIPVDHSPQKLAEILTMIGLEAEGVEDLIPLLKKLSLQKFKMSPLIPRPISSVLPRFSMGVKISKSFVEILLVKLVWSLPLLSTVPSLSMKMERL